MRSMFWIGVWFGFLSTTLPLAAQPPKAEPKPGDVMIEKYLAAEADKLSKKYMDGAKSLDEWKSKRPRLYQEYMDMLGLWPIPEKTPLKATVTKVHEAHGVIVENLHFQSKPGLYVTANLFRPKNTEPKAGGQKATGSTPASKLPAILYVCGHSGRGRDGGRGAFQDHGFWFANNGYVCLIVDTLQLGEIPGIHHGTYGLRGGKGEAPTRMWWHSMGYTPAGVEAWNGVRGIDYLVSRPEVDPERIGVTGISGGGAATFWVTVADERVKVAVPVSGMADLESYVKNKVINGHCDCMFLYNTYQWDWTTIAAMVAPRPMLFANSDNDPIFPMDANRRVIAKLKTAYGMYGKENLVDEYVSVGGHAYRPDLRVAIFKFLNKHLKGDTTTPVEDSAKYTEIKGRDLRAFAEDSDLPKDSINHKADEVFVPTGKLVLPAKEKFAEWRDGVIQRIRREAFRPLPEKVPALGPFVDAGLNAESEPGILVGTIFGGDPNRTDGRRAFVINPTNRLASAKILEFWNEELFRLTGIGIKIYGNLRGVNPLWTEKSPPNYVERSHELLGRTIDQGRVRDVLAFIPDLGGKANAKKVPTLIVGEGTDGILAAYGGLLDPSINEVVIIAPPTSHKQGPHFPGILRICDIPDALGLLAPRPLTIIGDDPAFDRTEEIYRLAGAADKLKRVKK